MDNLLTVNEVADLLGCHHVTVRRMIARGDLGEIVRIGRKFIRIRRATVEAYIKQHSEGVNHGQ